MELRLSMSHLASGVAALALVSSVQTAQAEGELEWSLELAAQAGAISSDYDLAPLSTVAVPQQEAESAVGRFAGRLDFTWSQGVEGLKVGVEGGIYSMANSAYDDPSGITEFDRANLGLTRIRENEILDFDKLIVFYDNDVLGRFEFGWTKGPNANLKVSAPHDYGLGGPGGDFAYFFDKPQDVGYLSLSALGSENTSPRIAYYSPEFFGTVLGVSYQADTRNQGFDFNNDDPAYGYMGRRVLAVNAPLDAALDVVTPTSSMEAFTAGFQNVMEVSARSEFDFGPFNVQGSVGIIQGDAIASPTGMTFNDLSSYQVGLQVGYGDLKVGAGISRSSDSGYPVLAHWRQRAEAYAANVGAQYDWEKFTFGAGLLYGDDAGDASERSDRQLRAAFAGVTYRHSDQLDFGVELDRVGTLSADYGDYINYALLAQVRYRIGSASAK